MFHDDPSYAMKKNIISTSTIKSKDLRNLMDMLTDSQVDILKKHYTDDYLYKPGDGLVCRIEQTIIENCKNGVYSDYIRYKKINSILDE